VQTQTGEWWIFMLAMRPYGGYFYNLGRETSLAPVRWEERWPIVSPGAGRVESSYPVPDLPETPWNPVPARDDFDAPTLAFHWNYLRTPRDDFYSLSGRPGCLRLRLRPQCLSEPTNPSFVGRRQQHIHFKAQCAVEFAPQSEHECAGLVLIQNNNFNFQLVLTKTTKSVLRLIKRADGEQEVLAEQPINSANLLLKIEAHEQEYGFYFAENPEAWQPLATKVDGRILSTPVAGGFVGAYIAMYASSNGQPSANHADFDWFEYAGSDL
jgi:alpha-N-arabinofuranosidase